MIISKIKPHRQPQFFSPALELDSEQMIITNPKSNGDFVENIGVRRDSGSVITINIKAFTDNVYSVDRLAFVNETEKMISFSARVNGTDAILPSEYSEAVNIGKLAAPVVTVEDDKLVLYNAATFGNATDIDIYINGEYSKTIQANGETEIEIPLSEFVTGYSKYTMIAKNKADTRWVNSDLSNEVKSLRLHETTVLSEARHDLIGGSVGNYAVFAGGYGLYYSQTVDAFDSSLVRIIATPLIDKASVGDASGASANVGGYLIFSSAGSYSIYDENLTQVKSYSGVGALYGEAGASLTNYALFAGGMSDYYKWEYSSVVRVFDENLTMTFAPDLSSKKYGAASANAGSYAVFAGGLPESINDVDAYSEDLTKVTCEALSCVRLYHAGATAGNCALFAGGRKMLADTIFNDSVDAYDENLSKVSVEDLTTSRVEMASVTHNNNAVFAGGRHYKNNENERLTTVEIYSDELVKTVKDSLTIGREELAAASVGEMVLFAGGYSNNAPVTIVDTVDVLLFD